MKSGRPNLTERLILILVSLLPVFSCFGQAQQEITLQGSPEQKELYLGSGNAGTELLKNHQYEDASSFFTKKIQEDDGDRNAYFNRGVARWELNDTLNACRDWSSLLALGDTATYLLLEKNCHSDVTIEEDVIPVKQFRRLTVGTSPKSDADKSGAHIVVDQMPLFPGGMEGLFAYLQKNIRYPESARKKNIQGKVDVNFIITSRGNVLFPYVERGPGGGCNEEAVRVVKNMPVWSPGKLNGKPTLVRMVLPVNFTLK
ncbi:MAG: energy transducer TonB [Bacteroidia bacterium]|nr:energy transducer TonB [Bacteroidia bacterium]